VQAQLSRNRYNSTKQSSKKKKKKKKHSYHNTSPLNLGYILTWRQNSCKSFSYESTATLNIPKKFILTNK